MRSARPIALFILAATSTGFRPGFAQTPSQAPPSVPTTPAVEPPVSGTRRAPTGRSIEGVVLGANNTPVPGAIVQIKDSKTLQVRSFIAQQDGRYHFWGLSTDVNYELRAAAGGMTSKTKTVSVFNSRSKVNLNLKLTKKFKP